MLAIIPRVESQYKNFWQNLVATFCPLFTRQRQLAALQTLEVPLDGANTADS